MAVAILVVHLFARTASFTHYAPVDSMTYALAAYSFWQPDATLADLVPDKPPGQAFLTGWCYLLAPLPPTRMVLLPIEAAFLLGAYLVFWRIGRAWLEALPAAVLTLWFAGALNAYNVMDFTTDGFNLNECYLALPMLLAVQAHLSLKRPAWRGLLQGLAIGVALSIKQSAVGLLGVLIVHECVQANRGQRLRDSAAALATTLAGLLAALAPLAIILAVRGWLLPHLCDLGERTGGHVRPTGWSFPPWYHIAPLLPGLLWITFGLLVLNPDRNRGTGSERANVSAGSPPSVAPAFTVLGLWLIIELAILQSMVKPSAHYHQQMTMPLMLLAGLAWRRFSLTVRGLPRDEGSVTMRWAGVSTAVAALIAFMPIFSEASRRVHTFDYETEVGRFAKLLDDRASQKTLPGLPIGAPHGTR